MKEVIEGLRQAKRMQVGIDVAHGMDEGHVVQCVKDDRGVVRVERSLRIISGGKSSQ